MSVCEHDYLQYSWIVFPHCSTVTAVSQVSVDKFLVSLVSNDHISYRDDFSCLCLIHLEELNPLGKKLSSNTLSAQLSTVLSNFICSFLILATLRNFNTVQNQSHRSRNTGKSGVAIC